MNATEYKQYLLNNLNRGTLVRNGGKEYAAILMSVMFEHTDTTALIYCRGFDPKLVCEASFWGSFTRWINDPSHILYAVVDTDYYMNEAPLQFLLKKKRSLSKRERQRIKVKLIGPTGKDYVRDIYGEECHFSIFDTQKFRYEYDPKMFKAFGSFNQPETVKTLTEVFSVLFNDKKAKELI